MSEYLSPQAHLKIFQIRSDWHLASPFMMMSMSCEAFSFRNTTKFPLQNT